MQKSTVAVHGNTIVFWYIVWYKMITVLKYYGITMAFVLVERVDVYIFPDWICMYSECEQSA